MQLPLTGFRQVAVVNGFFFVLSIDIRPIVGDPYGRIGGHALLWVRSERAQQVAKPEPVTESLAGMCGSVRH